MTAPLLPPPPRPSVRQELYSVVMSNVSVQDLLFALARDAKLNVDIHPSISGTVTMNVRDQTMTEILDRVARQVDLRYEFNGKDLSIQPDTPFLRHYRVQSGQHREWRRQRRWRQWLDVDNQEYLQQPVLGNPEDQSC